MSLSHELDRYWKLRPAAQRPDDEICRCARVEAVMLCDRLGENPLYCMVCNGEVLPERLGFDDRLTEAIASWRFVHRSLYWLWLESGEYEAWAAQRLADPQGEVHRTGRDVVRRLNETVRAYYWWFQDSGDDQPSASRCPLCGGELLPCGDWPFRKCDGCSLLV
jgi:hypothetical protein